MENITDTDLDMQINYLNNCCLQMYLKILETRVLKNMN